MHSTSVVRGLLLSVLVVALPQMALAQQGDPPKMISPEQLATPPDATIKFEASQFHLILGGASGEGMLDFQGKDIPLNLGVGGVP